VRRSFTITRGLTVVALIGLMVLAILGFRAQEKDLESLRASSQEIIYWSTSQGEAELSKFSSILGLFVLRMPGVTAKQVNKQFDILWSRVELFRQGDVGRRIRSYDTESGVIPSLLALLEKHEAAVVNISHDEKIEEHQRILADFMSAGERLRDLSLRVLQGEQHRLGGSRDAVRSSARLTWIFSMAALVLSLLLIGIMLIETRRYRRMAEESAVLAARAEAANRAKSRFLTMMSHELRTPMNGVLGLLALARQTSLNEHQIRLIDQAERSGRQMSALLGDILDFSDLQSETLVMDRELFELRNLAGAVEEMFGPIVHREGVAFAIEIDPDAPRWVVGDLVRLRQMLGHFVTYLIDIVGSKDVRLVISRDNANICFEIDVAVRDSGQPGWQPEAMFGRMAAQYGDFASDSLGPMIARGLAALMGGVVSLDRPRDGRASLFVSVPLGAAKDLECVIRIEAESVTVRTVLSALLKKLACPVWEPGMPPRKVSATLMEAGNDEEGVWAARLRSELPAAQLVAVGTPHRPALFDAICPQPVTAEALEAALAPAKVLRASAS